MENCGFCGSSPWDFSGPGFKLDNFGLWTPQLEFQKDKRFDGNLKMKFCPRKWFRKQLENQSKWDVSLDYIGIFSSFAIQDETEKEKYIHTLA